MAKLVNLAVLALLLAAVPAAGEGNFPTGNEWGSSTTVVKRAYLLGISDLMSAAKAVGRTSSQSPVIRLYNATRSTTIDQVVGRIDRWYADNPQRRDEQVIEVLWLLYVGE